MRYGTTDPSLPSANTVWEIYENRRKGTQPHEALLGIGGLMKNSKKKKKEEGKLFQVRMNVVFAS